MVGRTNTVTKPDPKLLLGRPAPGNGYVVKDALLSGTEILASIPTCAAYNLKADKNYYVYGFVAKSTSPQSASLPSKDNDSALIERLTMAIGIGAGGWGGEGQELYGCCGSAGGMVLRQEYSQRALPQDVKVYTVYTSYDTTFAVQKMQVYDSSSETLRESSLWAADGVDGADNYGSRGVEDGQNGPFRLLWGPNDILASGDESHTASGGAYGPGAGGGGGNVGGYRGGAGAPGGAVFFFELR